MLDKLVGAVAVAGVVTAIALGTRQDLVRASRSDTAASAPGTAAPARVGAAPAVAPASAAPVAPSGGSAAPSAAPAPALGPKTAEAAAPGVAPVPQTDARALLRKASQAYGRVRSMTASFVQVMRNPLLGSTTTSRGTLSSRRPDRFALRFTQPAGDVIVSDGRWFWVYYPSADPKQVIRFAAARGPGGVDLQSQFMGDAVNRFDATLLGRESVGGRQAYVLRLVPRTPAEYKELKVWLDPTDYIARRFEITEENGSVRRFDLSNVRLNPAVGDGVFRFTPPAGAQVISR